MSLLLAQKFYAVLNRKRNKGRDFYDIAFLLSMQIDPAWSYLEQKTSISNKEGLKNSILAHCEKIDMDEMARDVAPYLFQAKDAKKVALFSELMRQM